MRAPADDLAPKLAMGDPALLGGSRPDPGITAIGDHPPGAGTVHRDQARFWVWAWRLGQNFRQPLGLAEAAGAQDRRHHVPELSGLGLGGADLKQVARQSQIIG